jgi:hypothetical protein
MKGKRTGRGLRSCSKRGHIIARVFRIIYVVDIIMMAIVVENDAALVLKY